MRLRRYAATAALAVSFAAHTILGASLTGRVPAAAYSLALSLGALGAALIAAGRPVAAVRALDRRTLAVSGAGGALAVFAAPALVAAVRMSDAPAGSVAVFWTAPAWAALAAAAVAAGFAGRSDWRRAATVAAGALAVLAGAAGVLADWERPSSFSPLVKFPAAEVAMLAAGLLLLAGVGALAHAGLRARPGALVVASALATALSAVWALVSGAPAVSAAFAQTPAAFALAAAAWGATVVALPAAWRDPGPAAAAAAMGIAPVAISALALAERAVGVSGPQPMVVPGVAAGSLLAVAGCAALLRAGRDGAPAAGRFPRALATATAVPIALAAVSLALPALVATVEHETATGTARLAWTMTGADSVAVWSALALAGLAGASARWRSAAVPAVALAACAAWPALLDVPTHVWVRGLSPAIQQDYGTEYASITFTHAPVTAASASVALSAAALAAALVLAVIGARRGTGGTPRTSEGQDEA